MTDTEQVRLRRPVRCTIALAWLAVLASGGGLVYSLGRPGDWPSVRELGWQRKPVRTWRYERMDNGSEPRVRVQFGADQRFGLVRMPWADRGETKPYLLTRAA